MEPRFAAVTKALSTHNVFPKQILLGETVAKEAIIQLSYLSC